jgi:hypothetical protein
MSYGLRAARRIRRRKTVFQSFSELVRRLLRTLVFRRLSYLSFGAGSNVSAIGAPFIGAPLLLSQRDGRDRVPNTGTNGDGIA